MSGEPVYTGPTKYSWGTFTPPPGYSPATPVGNRPGGEVYSTVNTPSGTVGLAEGASRYSAEENATYVGTKEGVMRYEGRQTSVGGRLIKSGTVMEGANAPSSTSSPEAQARFQALKAAEELKAQRELAAKQVADNRAAAVEGVGGLEGITGKLREKFSVNLVGAKPSVLVEAKERLVKLKAFGKFLSEDVKSSVPSKPVVEPDSDFTRVGAWDTPTFRAEVTDVSSGKTVETSLTGANELFESKPITTTTTETFEVLPPLLPSTKEMAELAEYPSNAEYQRQKAVEGFQTESENQLFGLPIVGGGLKWFEESVSGVQEYLSTKNVFGLEKDVVSSSFSKSVLGAASIVKPSTLVSAAKTGGVIVEEAVSEPQQFFKRVGTGVSIMVKSEETAFRTNPAEATATVLGTAAGFYLLSGGKPLDFLKYPKEARAVEGALSKPLSVSRGLVIGEETGRGLAVRVKAVKTVLGETGLKEVPIDVTFLGTVKESAGKQADVFIRANKAAVSEAGGRFKVLSVEKTASSILQTSSRATVTGKGLRVELKGGGTSVFTRVKGEPTTVFLSTGEVAGEGVINIPKSRWRLNIGSKENFPNSKALDKVSVRGQDIPFKLEYASTGSGGIVEAGRIDADFANVGKGVVDASTGKAKQDLLVRARSTNTPFKDVPATEDFINRHPKLLRLSVGAKKTFVKPLEYIKAKTREYGAQKLFDFSRGTPSTEESFFNLRELGEKQGKNGKVAELYSGHGRTFSNEPIAKPLELRGKTLEQLGYSKNNFFGKVKRLVTDKSNGNGGANNRPLSRSGGGASVEVGSGGGSKQLMELSEAGSKSGEPRVLAVPTGISEVQVRAAASRAVDAFYSKAAVRSSALGVVSAKAVTTHATTSKSAFNTSNRSGTMQFTRTDTRTSMQPVTRVSNRSGTMLENKTDSRTVNRMFDVGATRTRAVSLTGTGVETRNVFSTALRNVAGTATRTATRTATLTRTQTFTKITPTSITPPPTTIEPPPKIIVIPKGDVLGTDKKRKRVPVKFFLKSKSRKTGRAPLSDLLNLNITALAIRGKPHSPNVKTANKFFARTAGLAVPTQEQIRSKFRF